MRKVIGGGWVGGGLLDYIVSPSPIPFPLDFGFWTRILDLDFGLGFGTGLGLDKNLYFHLSAAIILKI